LTALTAGNIRFKALILLVVLIASLGVAGCYAALQPQTIPLEVKEPLEIVGDTKSLSLYPGETVNFTVTVENHASVSYSASLSFTLNDTQYQQQFAIFSNTVYTVEPGANSLDASLFISSTAPAAELELTISITRDVEPTPTASPILNSTTSPTNSSISLTPVETLLGAGARWAAQNGTSALYIDWLDNYNLNIAEGTNWGPYWGVDYLSDIKNSTVEALEQQGFNVTCTGEVPNDLSSYSLVIFEAYYAVEPRDNQLIRNYLANGGDVVITGGVPCYLATYCKDMWPGETGGGNLSSLQDWFGSSQYVNSGGTSNLVVGNPFGTSLLAQNQLYYINAYSAAALTSMSSDSTVIARWSDGSVFAFTHQYLNGRIYYQVAVV